MKKCLILHGWGWSSEWNWFPWLKKNMESKWYEVFLYDLPNSTIPEYDEQINFLNFQKLNLLEWDVIFWHSLWCKLAMNYVENNQFSWLKIYLVAPVYPWLAEDKWRGIFWDAFDSILKYFNTKTYFKKLWNTYKIFLSNNDPYIDIDKAKNYLWNLENREFIEFKNMWHFLEWTWNFEFNELFDY